MGSGTGITSGEITYLARIFTPGILPNIVSSPSGSAQDLHRLFAGVFFGEICKTRTTSRIDGCLNLVGHTEELAKQNTFNNLDPYDDDDAIFLHTDDAKDHFLRKALNTKWLPSFHKRRR